MSGQVAQLCSTDACMHFEPFPNQQISCSTKYDLSSWGLGVCVPSLYRKPQV